MGDRSSSFADLNSLNDGILCNPPSSKKSTLIRRNDAIKDSSQTFRQDLCNDFLLFSNLFYELRAIEYSAPGSLFLPSPRSGSNRGVFLLDENPRPNTCPLHQLQVEFHWKVTKELVPDTLPKFLNNTFRQGIRSLVLESLEHLRVSGFGLLTWTNAWKSLDAVGVGDSLRQEHERLLGNVTSFTISGLQTSEMSFNVKGKYGEHEVRCLKRKLLLETLSNELFSGTIRYSSKVVCIEESSFFKLVHLADGKIIKTKWWRNGWGFKKPAFTGRSAIRDLANFEIRHGFEPLFMQFFRHGVRCSAMPFDDKSIYWAFTWAPSTQEERELEEKPEQMRQYIMSKLGNIPEKVRSVIENTELEAFSSSPLRYRPPLELLLGNINKGNVCVTGDALHPMTPDIGQGGCSALEDGVVLARCLGEALLEMKQNSVEAREEYKRIEMGLKKYAKERRWRSFDLTSIAYVVGSIQESHGKVISFLREKLFAAILAGLLLKRADFDCGKLLHIA
ncbi:hypothetical protein FNV43_RR21831 [Rhamnella rubrinervis]|uniref:FAD-binding domain-containing protein n=1 Tax=Rhamnella rubrinervis TaxID=2594499 RepID=A0A8K0DTY8_9ROSA|nr:hypothetical protein FNV43_RR21831 [Rhamnella rubrinervis]